MWACAEWPGRAEPDLARCPQWLYGARCTARVCVASQAERPGTSRCPWRRRTAASRGTTSHSCTCAQCRPPLAWRCLRPPAYRPARVRNERVDHDVLPEAAARRGALVVQPHHVLAVRAHVRFAVEQRLHAPRRTRRSAAPAERRNRTQASASHPYVAADAGPWRAPSDARTSVHYAPRRTVLRALRRPGLGTHLSSTAHPADPEF